MSARKQIRIGIDGRVLMHYEMRGFARYTVEVLRALKENAGERIALYSFSPGPIAPEFAAVLDIKAIVFPARREILWEQIELPKQLRRERIEVFHATANRGLPYRRVCGYVLTCHDVIDRMSEYCEGENWRGALRKRYSDFISRRSASRYITVSNYSKQDISRFHGLAEKRVVVIYNAAHTRFYERLTAEPLARARGKYSLPAVYFLFLGGFDKRKNVGTLLDAFSQLSPDVPPLVLAGEHKWGFGEIQAKIRDLRLQGRVLCPDQIDDADLPAIYQSALALVHPSRYEGFGLQLVEAMASGIPVLASETTSLPEVLEGSGLLFNPEDASSIARQMERIFRDPALQAAIAEKCRHRGGFFSWEKAAVQTLEVYEQVLGLNAQDPVECGQKAVLSGRSR
ncbi:MAG: glycosyltransferase family 1 protein [Terriglobales bacterium]